LSIAVEKCTVISVEKCTTENNGGNMEMLYFVFILLKIILASEGAGTATGEAKIIFGKFVPTYHNFAFSILPYCNSFTYCKGGLKIQGDDYNER
jgi:hypothetical protein